MLSVVSLLWAKVYFRTQAIIEREAMAQARMPDERTN